MAFELGKMSLNELLKLQTRVEKAIAKAEGQRKKEARAAMEKLARDYGVSFEEVVAGTSGAAAKMPKAKKAAKAKAPPKFANPADKTQTWSGKGRQPDWFKAAVGAGTDPSAMAV